MDKPMPTIPQAKNAITSALRQILDAQPSATVIAAMWIHFGAACAFCGLALDRDAREGHRDHLVARAAGGSNHPANLVLACGRCNGDERRNADWRSFLAAKCRTPRELEERSERISTWVAQHGGESFQQNEALQELVLNGRRSVFEALDLVADRFRAARDGAS
jgi:hypothetical protein